MHDLLLFGQIPESRYGQLRQILAGLTGLPEPRPIFERRYIFRPNRAPVQKVEQLGGSQNITDVHKLARKQRNEEEPRYCMLIENMTMNDSRSGANGDSASIPTPVNARASRARFTLNVSDVPEPEIKSVMSMARTTTAITSDDALESLESQGQRFVHQYAVEGCQFVLNQVVIRLQRCMQLVPRQADAQPRPQATLSEFDMKPWDESGGYMLQATVTISDGKNPELVRRGTEELKRLKEDLRGCVELRTLERLSMDPRVK